MKFDLAFVLIDLGDPFYKQAASEMIRSARRAYKGHDMRVVQLSDTKTAPHPDADGAFVFDTEVDKSNLCQFKGGAIASYALQAECPAVFCDVDILWNNADLLDPRRAVKRVGCLWRDNMPSMPFNTGLIVTQPHQNTFWELYRSACENLPVEVQGWFGDQFAMTAAECGQSGGVTRLPMDQIAPATDALPSEPLTTPAVHFKGPRKAMMFQYARMLDGGAGFDFVRPGVTRPAHIAAQRALNEQRSGQQLGATNAMNAPPPDYSGHDQMTNKWTF